MLINHDFDWEPELEEPPRSGVDATAGNSPRPELSVVCAEGNPRPSPQLVIIERAQGFSRSTLIHAIIALALSAAAMIRKTTHSNAASLIDHTSIQPAAGIPARADRERRDLAAWWISPFSARGWAPREVAEFTRNLLATLGFRDRSDRSKVRKSYAERTKEWSFVSGSIQNPVRLPFSIMASARRKSGRSCVDRERNSPIEIVRGYASVRRKRDGICRLSTCRIISARVRSSSRPST